MITFIKLTSIALILSFLISNNSSVTFAAAEPLPGGDADCSGFLACLQGIRPGGLKVQFWNPGGQGSFIGRLVSEILPIIIGLAGFLAVVLIIISGIQFVTSSGNPEAAAAARGRLIYAIIGFIVIALAFVITQIIDQIFLNSGVI